MGAPRRAGHSISSCAICGAATPRAIGSVGADALFQCRWCRSVSTVSDAADASYDEAYYEAGYLRFAHERSAYLDNLLSRLDSGEGRSLLDSGCGAGLALDAAQRAGWQPFGVDPSPAALAAAARRHQVVRGSSEQLPLRSGGAAAVLLLDVAAHLAQPAGAILEASRALAPEGLLLIKTPRRPAWAYRLTAVFPLRLRRLILHLPYQRHAISNRGLRSILAAAGLEALSVEKIEEAVPLRRRLTGSWKTRLAIVFVSAFEAAYGRPSSVVVARRG